MKRLIKLISNNKILFGILGAFGIYAIVNDMNKKRIFISFAIEDQSMRDLLVGQTINSNCPFEFKDRSVYEPWKKAWKTNCREVIKECDGVIALLSNNTWNAEGQRWEIKCAIKENIPIIGVHAYRNKKQRGAIPTELRGEKVIEWKWQDITNFINSI